MTEVVINRCFGGFGLSVEAVVWMREHGYEAGEKCKLTGEWNRSGTRLITESESPVVPNGKGFRTRDGVVEVVRTLGDNANGSYSNLEIIEVEDGSNWTIEGHDGLESITYR